MAIQFPSGVASGTEFSDAGVLWKYDGEKWVSQSTSGSGTAGEIRATNNITAYYSDERLKEFEGKIDNALEKVLALSGYYYKENELAKELGYDNDRRQVGLSAQEVKKILPEVITEAPIDDQYLTIWYDKLIPLIIEAIKELYESGHKK